MQTSNAIINVIPKGRPKHISLDFNGLRAEGIKHLENLATEIWTDFNAHDPGITLLELLCYAITDLGYRTQMLPIADIAAGPGTEKRWFEAPEILPMSPVTAWDLRKVIIDVEGVANAWLERARPEDFRIKDPKGAIKWLDKEVNFCLKPEAKDFLKAQLGKGVDFLLKRFGPAAAALASSGADVFEKALGEFNQLTYVKQRGWIDKVRKQFGHKLIDHIICTYGYFKLRKTEKPEDALPLNGVYRILIQLDDHLDPQNEKLRKRYIHRVLRRLHEHRGLCQDYLLPEIVQNWNFCVCLDLETDPAYNETEIAAEAMRRIQEYLVPSVHFYNFKDMRARGLACDRIFNGPLLENGFIPDDELKASEKLPKYIYRSDLQRVVLEIPGVLDLRDLRIKAPGTTAFSEEWKIPVAPEDWEDNDKKEKCPPGNLRPRLDPCCSRITLRRNGLQQTLGGNALEAAYEALLMAHQPMCDVNPGQPDPAAGTFRSDLGEYRTVQYELPAVYSVGNYLPRKGNENYTRQLQAYLLFYDQILAGYLAQLGQVRKLFAVEQNPADPTMVLQPLFDVPGAKEIMGEFADLYFSADVITHMETISEGEQILLGKKLNQLLDALAKAGTDALKQQIQQRIDENKALTLAVAKLPDTLLPLVGKTYNKGLAELRSELRSLMGAELFDKFGIAVEDTVWEYYISQESNNITQALDHIADPSARRQNRRGRLLDHLIARFGETFSDYVATLTRADADPEDNPWREDFAEYLRDKARFLQTIATTGAERGRGFNYRQFDQFHQPDVWNTGNVSGLQKRVARLLGIDSWKSHSLLGTLPYVIDIVAQTSKQGAPVYLVQLKSRHTGHDKHQNPVKTGALLSSNPFKSREVADKFRMELYQRLDQPELLKWRPAKGDTTYAEVYFDYQMDVQVGGKTVTYELKSAARPTEVIDEFLAELKCLIGPDTGKDTEGFHLIEHILLRPDDHRDALLELSLGCDPDETPRDPYSFWLTIVLPKEAGRFQYPDFRDFVEQTFRKEAPAHLALRFCWVNRDQLLEFEPLFKAWLEAKAKCSPDECHVTDAANELIGWMNRQHCTCACHPTDTDDSACAHIEDCHC